MVRPLVTGPSRLDRCVPVALAAVASGHRASYELRIPPSQKEAVAAGENGGGRSIQRCDAAVGRIMARDRCRFFSGSGVAATVGRATAQMADILNGTWYSTQASATPPRASAIPAAGQCHWYSTQAAGKCNTTSDVLGRDCWWREVSQLAAVSAAPSQMWQCEPSPGADVAGARPVPVQTWQRWFR